MRYNDIAELSIKPRRHLEVNYSGDKE